MTSLKLTPNSIEADGVVAVLALAGLVAFAIWVISRLTANAPTTAWDMPVVGSGTADEPSQLVIPTLPNPISDR
jgi:hypothetical protein